MLTINRIQNETSHTLSLWGPHYPVSFCIMERRHLRVDWILFPLTTRLIHTFHNFLSIQSSTCFFSVYSSPTMSFSKQVFNASIISRTNESLPVGFSIEITLLVTWGGPSLWIKLKFLRNLSINWRDFCAALTSTCRVAIKWNPFPDSRISISG